MGAHLDTTRNRLRRVQSETTGYLSSVVYYKKTHAYAVRRMRAIRESSDWAQLPRWARDRIHGYESGYFDAIHHLLEWRYRKIADGTYISQEQVNWGQREIDGGAHFWKGTDIMYSDPPLPE